MTDISVSKRALLEVSEVSKQFPGVLALDSISFSVYEGDIHGVCGENGAGKSTLMKILSGVYPWGSYEGTITFDGRPIKFANVKNSEAVGIRVIYQELTLVKQMTVAENIFLGEEPVRHGIIDWNKLYSSAKQLLEDCRLHVPYAAQVITLGIGQQQMVEIAKALSGQVKLLILDEPTSALTQDEVHTLMDILRDLKVQGVTCIYISHKLEELLEITDRITVLRDGKMIGTEYTQDLTEDQVISMMVGRELTGRFPQKTRIPGEVIFSVRDWSVADPERPEQNIIEDISFDLRRGEILGVAGLMGSGRTELVQSLFGEYGTPTAGETLLDGEPVRIRSSRDAIKLGIALATEDRRNTGLIVLHSVLRNMSLPSLPNLSRGQIIDPNLELATTSQFIERLRIKTPTVNTIVNTLSGGNQQKVSIAKWLMTQPKILILDEPTRGIDVGTKYEIYKLMDELAAQGVGIIMVSSELPEIMGMSDRILVIHNGRRAGILGGQKTTMEEVMSLAAMGETTPNSREVSVV